LPAGWQTQSLILRRPRGLAWEGNTDVVLSTLASRCDGLTTGAALIAWLAEATGRSEDEVRPLGLAALRTMIELGFVQISGY